MTATETHVARSDETSTGDGEPRVRTAIAVLVSRFPRIDETYILREINELERQGQPVVLVPILRGSAAVIHDEAKPWLRRALYLPLFSATILLSNLRAFARMPLRFLRLLFTLSAATIVRPRTLVRTLAAFPRAVHLARVLPSIGVRHVHAHFATHATTMAYVISALSDVTYSFTVHGPDIFVHRLLLARKLANAKFVRAISTFNKAFLAGLYPAFEKKIAVVHMGLDPDVYRQPRESRDPSGPLRILSVASLLPSKGFGFLVDACALLLREGMDIDCTIVGDGPARTATEEWIDRHGLSRNVRLLGALPQHEVARVMCDCDVFVLPSIIAPDGQMDGIPMALMEAMAAGNPVVAASISGIPELVTNRVNGILVDATHAERIAQSIRELADPRIREQMGRAGQQKVRDDFHVRRTAAQVIELLDHAGDSVTTDTAAEIAAMEWPGLRPAAVGVRRLHERLDSLVAEIMLTDGGGTRELVIKQHRSRSGESRPARVRARHELSVMRALRTGLDQHAAAEVCCGVPSVEAFDEERAALLIGRAHGTALDVLIRHARNHGGSVGKLAIPLRHTGLWLRTMQEVTRSSHDGRHLLTAVVLLALQDLDRAAAADRGLRRDHDRFIDALRRLESRVAERELAVVGHHGDYWPGNVFIDDRRVEVIDFEGFREGLPLEDVAYFIVMLELPFGYPFLRQHVRRLTSSFLDGYLGPDLALDREALRLFTAAKALQILTRGGAAARGTPKTWWLRRNLIRIVRRSLA